MFFKRTADLSLPERRVVCGVEVRKMPLGAYLKALRILSEEAGKLYEAIYGGVSKESLFAAGEGKEGAGEEGSLFSDFLPGLLERAPMVFVHVLAELVEVAPERLIEDEGIGLEGVLEIAVAFCEINSLGKCRRLLGRLTETGVLHRRTEGAPPTSSGCSG